MTTRQRLSIKAIVMGFVAALGAALLVSWAYIANAGTGGLTPDEFTAELEARTSYWIFVLVMGIAATVFGGYVTARVAKHRELAHAVAVAIVWLVLSALMVIASLVITKGEAAGPPAPAWFHIGAYGLTLPASLLGGWLARCERERREAPERQACENPP